MSLRRVLAIARAEALLNWRDPRSLVVIFVLPVLLLVLYGYGLNFDLRNLPTAVYDQDHTELSQRIVQRAVASGYFKIVGEIHNDAQLAEALRERRALMVLVIPPRFTADIAARRQADLQVALDASDATTAGTGLAYVQGLVTRLAQDEARRWALRSGLGSQALSGISVRVQVLYNPGLVSAAFIVPGLMGVVMALMAALLTSTCIVREREVGTMEALLATPARPADVLLGKLLPYAALAMMDIGLCVIAGRIIFDVWPRGSLFDLAWTSVVFVSACLFIGLTISGRAASQRTAIVGGIMTLMLPTIILSGFIFPVANFPPILKAFANILPATHYLVAVRAIYLRGVSPFVFWPNLLALVGEALILFVLSVRLFRARL